MSDILKSVSILKGEVDDALLARINQLTLQKLTAEQVYVFRMVACDNQVDRDCERFSDQVLQDMSIKFTGKPVIFDHNWSASKQTARVFDGTVEEVGQVKRLVLSCYMLNNSTNASLISAISGGILKECSIGVAVAMKVCSICGAEYDSCTHQKRQTYDGNLCHVVLDQLEDVYEVSFVAVPAQREAGIIKSFQLSDPMEAARCLLEIEQQRYGGYYE